MIKRILTTFTAALLVSSLVMAPVQAAGFSHLQPYLSNYKIGFTNGAKLTTPAVYDEFQLSSHYAIVKKANKQGILDLQTGKEIIAPDWDNIEILGNQNIVVLWNGGMAQYYNLQSKTLSKQKFKTANAFYLSDSDNSVMAFGGDQSMLVDSSGKVLLQPFKGKINWVDIAQPATNGESLKLRTLAITTDQLSLLDPQTFKPLFAIPNAKLLQEENYEVPFLQVVVNGKVGAVDIQGRFVVEPKYKSPLLFLQNGYTQVESEAGKGLFRQGEMLAEPVYDEVGTLYDRPNTFYTVKGDVVTYHNLDKQLKIDFKKNAEYFGNGYIIGQDAATGLYGVKNVNNETIIPFVYRNVEQTMNRILVREDGKKGVIPFHDGVLEEPKYWFDSFEYIGSFIFGKDGNTTGVLSMNGQVISPPQENITVTYDKRFDTVIVKDGNGTETEFDYHGKKVERSQTSVSSLTDQLNTESTEQGVYLIKKETGEKIDKPYANIYFDNEAQIVVAMAEEGADLYSPDGTKINQDVTAWVETGYTEGPPVVFRKFGESTYVLAKKPGQQGLALLRITGGQSTVLTDFAYNRMNFLSLDNQTYACLDKATGEKDIYLLDSLGTSRIIKVSNVKDVITAPAGKYFFVNEKGAWDAYDTRLQRVTFKQYKSINIIQADSQRLITYQDRKTGLFGVLQDNGKELTPARYEAIEKTREVFPQLYFAQGLPAEFVYASGKYFGYMNAKGQEILHMPFLTKQPKITYLPMKSATFQGLHMALERNPLELLAFAKPYQFNSPAGSETDFYHNLAVYFNLPVTSTKQEIVQYLKSKNIITAEEGVFGYDEFYQLAYYMITGSANTTMTIDQLWNWGNEHGFVFDLSPHYYHDFHYECNQYFVTRLLFQSKEKQTYTVKKLDASQLSNVQHDMLVSLIQVNGMKYDSLRLPLPQYLENAHLKNIVSLYNQTAPRLIAEYIQSVIQ